MELEELNWEEAHAGASRQGSSAVCNHIPAATTMRISR